MYVSAEILNRLDELVRADLKNRRDFYFTWLLIATGAVLTGILMEGPEAARDLREGFRKRRSPNLADSHHPLWVLILTSIGWLLISSGVVGEGIFEALVSQADGSLQMFNDILLGSANETAGYATERAAELEREAAALRSALENSRTPRFLSRDAQLRISAKLAQFRGMNADLSYRRWAFDGLELARALRESLEGVGREYSKQIKAAFDRIENIRERRSKFFRRSTAYESVCGDTGNVRPRTERQEFAFAMAKALRDEHLEEVHGFGTCHRSKAA